MKEFDIRPKDLLDKYIELSLSDSDDYFDADSRLNVPCVACGSMNHAYQFTKQNFPYVLCDDCMTLFQNPRPSIETFERFYRESKSSKYWAEVFYPAVAEVRRKSIISPRVDYAFELIQFSGLQVNNLVDVGAGHGIFLEEWSKRRPDTSLLAIEPSASLAKTCRSKGITVAEDIVENIHDYCNWADLVTCFEVLEHVYSPIDFLRSLKRLIRPGGQVLISTLCIDGFDLQVLWDRSTQISPPHHINFISSAGFKVLMGQAGFINIEIYTPGKLDVDIVRNAISRDPELLIGRDFIKLLVRNEKLGEAFQNFLVSQKLSSHAWILGTKL